MSALTLPVPTLARLGHALRVVLDLASSAARASSAVDNGRQPARADLECLGIAPDAMPRVV